MARKIGEIREELLAADVGELPAFLACYRGDERAGVRALVERGEKRLAALEAEKVRTEQMKRYEKEYAVFGCICGIDEVGRGPLAGPVVAGAVILPEDCRILYLNDSKQLSETKREELFEVIREQAVATGIGFVSSERIDEINILQATYEAMRNAVADLGRMPEVLLNDAVTIPGIPNFVKQVPIIKGDAKSVSIAAASIIAKVTRDRLMVQYDSIFPEYGFASNKGYGSAGHIEAIRKFGPSPIHRRSFIRNVMEENH